MLVPNAAYWDKARMPLVDKVVFVPREDSDTEINALKSGQVDAIFPQPSVGIDQRLNDPNHQDHVRSATRSTRTSGSTRSRAPFVDPILRQAFVESVDTQKILDTIDKPIDPNVKRTSAWCGCRRSVSGATRA